MKVLKVIYGVNDYKKYKHLDDTYKGDKNKCNCLNYSINKKGDYIYNSKNKEFDKCQNKAITKNGFCEKHKKCFDFLKIFTNGYEPSYEPKKWNNNVFVNGSHNCYAYFLDGPKRSLTIKCKELCDNDKYCPEKYNECQTLIPQPGDAYLTMNKGNNNSKERKYLCKNMIKKIKADNPKIKRTNFTKKCPPNYYKGSMVVDHLDTFHFYRLNPDGTWSHKPGITDVTNIDANKKKIAIPHFASRNYKRDADSDINYDDFCGYFCIPTNKERSKYMA